jgi:hypothetical protein
MTIRVRVFIQWKLCSNVNDKLSDAELVGLTAQVDDTKEKL